MFGVLELDMEDQNKLTEPETVHGLAPFSGIHQWGSCETQNATLQQSRTTGATDLGCQNTDTDVFALLLGS